MAPGTQGCCVQVGAEGDGAQASSEVRPQGLPRGESVIPAVKLDFAKVEAVTRSYAACTLIGYFLGRPPPELVLKQWMKEVWEAHGWKVTSVRYLTKGFYAFTFASADDAEHVLLRGPWTCRRNLVVLNRWTTDFSVEDTVSFACPIWVEFPGLPLPLGEMLAEIVAPIGKFVCHEPHRMYNPRPHRRVCVQVDLTKDLPQEVLIDFGNGASLRQAVRYLNLPNTCFRCHSSEHMIRDCPLVAKAPPAQAAQDPGQSSIPPKGVNKEGWQTVRSKGRDGKAREAPEQRAGPSSAAQKQPEASTGGKRTPSHPEVRTRPRSRSPGGDDSKAESPPGKQGNGTLEYFFSRKKSKEVPIRTENPYQVLDAMEEGMECESPHLSQ